MSHGVGCFLLSALLLSAGGVDCESELAMNRRPIEVWVVACGSLLSPPDFPAFCRWTLSRGRQGLYSTKH